MEQRWTNIGFAPDVQLFTGRYGLQAELPDDHNEMDILDLFLTPELYELIIVETNRYAKQYFEKNTDLPPFARARQWKDVDANELKVFFVLTFSMEL